MTPKSSRKNSKSNDDSDTEIRYDEKNKPGVSNLLTIYSAFTGKPMDEIERHFADKMYGHLKIECAEAVIEGLRPIQNKYTELMADKAMLKRS